MKVFLKEYYNAGHEHSVQLNRWNNRIDKDYNELKGGDRTLMKLLDFTEKLYLENQELKKINNYEYNKKLCIYGIDMPYKTGKLKGELTSAEIRRLVSAHNRLSKIQIPKGTDRNGLIKLVETNGFRVDHKNEKLIQTRSKPLMKIDLPPKKTRVKKQPVKKQTVKKQTVNKVSTTEAKKLLGGDLPKENYGSQPTKSIYADTPKLTPEEKKLVDIQKFMKKTLDFMTKKQNKNLTTQQIKSYTKLIKNMFTQITKTTYKEDLKKDKITKTPIPPQLRKYSEKLLNLVYSNPPNPDKVDGVVIDFKSPELKEYFSYLTTSSIKKNKNTLNSYKPKKEKKQAVKNDNMIKFKLGKNDLQEFKEILSVLNTSNIFRSNNDLIKEIEKQNENSKGTIKMTNEQLKEITNDKYYDDTDEYYSGYVNQEILDEYRDLLSSPNEKDQAKFDKILSRRTSYYEKLINKLKKQIKKEVNKEVKKPEPPPPPPPKQESEEEEEDDEEPEEVSAFSDARLTKVRNELRKFIKEKMKEFKQIKKPTMKDVKKFNRTANKVVRDYEQKNNIEFTGKAQENLYDITQIFFDDMKFLVK